jgi:hypothetical protein
MLKQYFIILVSILIFFASVKIARNFVDDKSQYFEPIMEKNKYLYDLGLQGDLMLRMKGVILNGFHNPEHFGRWTSGPRSVIGNIQPPIIKGKIINICGFAFTPNIGVTGVLKIGKSKYDIEFLSKESCHNFTYNGNLVVKKIVIEEFNTISPKEIGINNDMRKLGVAIKSIEIK